jgi:NitT/TauT family transport system permease protein
VLENRIPGLRFGRGINLGGKGGLGWYIYQKRYCLETAAVFAGLATIVLIGLLVEHGVFRAVEQRTVRRWGMSA